MNNKDTYDSRELCDRYSVCLRTIHAWEKRHGYPEGKPFSKNILWSRPKVTAWEKIHMPHLHDGEAPPDDSEAWDRMMNGRDSDSAPPKRRARPVRRKK